MNDENSFSQEEFKRNLAAHMSQWERVHASLPYNVRESERNKELQSYINNQLAYVMSPNEKAHWLKAANTYMEGGAVPGIATQSQWYPWTAGMNGFASGLFDRLALKNERTKAGQMGGIANTGLDEQERAIRGVDPGPGASVPNQFRWQTPPLPKPDSVKVGSNMPDGQDQNAMYDPYQDPTTDPHQMAQALFNPQNKPFVG